MSSTRFFNGWSCALIHIFFCRFSGDLFKNCGTFGCKLDLWNYSFMFRFSLLASSSPPSSRPLAIHIVSHFRSQSLQNCSSSSSFCFLLRPISSLSLSLSIIAFLCLSPRPALLSSSASRSLWQLINKQAAVGEEACRPSDGECGGGGVAPERAIECKMYHSVHIHTLTHTHGVLRPLTTDTLWRFMCVRVVNGLMINVIIYV